MVSPHPPHPTPPAPACTARRSDDFETYSSINECCSEAFGKGGCLPPAKAAYAAKSPETCYSAGQFWPDRTCRVSTKCDKMFPTAPNYRTPQECCSRVHGPSSCKLSPTMCFISDNRGRNCIEGRPSDCRRGWGVYYNYDTCCNKEFGSRGCKDW
jgi:hypothetical protein